MSNNLKQSKTAAARNNKNILWRLVRKWSTEDANQPEITSLTRFLSDVEFEDGQEYLAAKALELIKFNSLNINLTQKDRLVSLHLLRTFNLGYANSLLLQKMSTQDRIRIRS